MKLFVIAGFKDYERVINHHQEILDFLEYEYNKQGVELIYPYLFLYPKNALEQGDRLSIREVGENAVISYDDGERIKEYIVPNELRAIREKSLQIGCFYQSYLYDKLVADNEVLAWCDGACILNHNNTNILEQEILNLEHAKVKELGLTTFLIPSGIIQDYQKKA